ncbi:OmpH family outer membrane protein [Candidatus Thioglobus sp.]|jgi:Outer membrane protein|uniref:OmpH family outer membrane protein n=1 Tax=Candidatus Thioglobus sp. TaxID=2026721 RepID=UPI003242AADC
MRFFAFILVLLSVPLQAQSLKIGYINIDHLVSSSPQFIQANQVVIKVFQPQEKQLLALSKQIQLSADTFNKNSKTLTQVERKTEIKKIANLERQLKQQAQALKKQLKLKNEQELSKIQDLINRVIKQVAEDQNFDLILYQEVAYASKKINITPIISQKLRLLFE